MIIVFIHAVGMRDKSRVMQITVLMLQINRYE